MAGLRRWKTALIVTLLSVFSAIIAVYAAEIVFTYETWWNELGTTDRVKAAALKAGAAWDDRTKAQLIADMKREGKEAFTTFAPSVYVEDDGLPYESGRIFPFATVSNVYAVYCQERGPWMVYLTDEHGFNNTKGLYVTDQLDVAVVGDSFTHGACLKPGEDIPALMRQAGIRALNLGIGGSGPVIFAAVQREYAKPIRPKTVFWLYYSVGIRTALYEATSPTLVRYLDDPGFTQDLINRQPELDTFLRGFLENEFAKRVDQMTTSREERMAIVKKRLTNEAMALTRVRQRIRNLGDRDTVLEGREEQKLAISEKAIREARDEARAWGGEFVFVYLPDWYNYARAYDSYGIKIDKNFLLRPDVLKFVGDMDIPIIDIQAEVFDKHPDPVSLFNWRMYGHYTPEGYRLVADRLIAYLRQKGAHF
jgi:hypothetical protein